MSLPCESLATKTELKELREKINKLLGATENGEEINVLEEETLEGTKLGDSIELSFSAMQDFTIADSSGNIVDPDQATVLTGIVAGGYQYFKVHGFNLTKSLSQASKIGKIIPLQLVKNKELAQVGAQAARVSGASIALLSSLVNIVTTLGLSIMETNTLGFRIDQTEKGLIQLHETQLTWGRLIAQNKGDLNKTKTQLVKQGQELKKQNKTIDELVKDGTQKQETINKLVDEINSANEIITELEFQNEELLQKIENVEYDLSTEIDTMKVQVQNNTNDLHTAKKNNQNMLKVAQGLGERLAKYQGLATELADRLGKTEKLNKENVKEINELKKELNAEFFVVNSKLKTHEAKLLALENKAKKETTGGGGFPQVARQNLADTQTATLQLTNTLAGKPLNDNQLAIDPNTLTFEKKFTELFKQLIPQISPFLPEVSDVQISDLEEALLTGITAKFTDFGLDKIGDNITDIKTQTTPDAIKKNVDDALCKSSNPGKCLNDKIKKPIQEAVKKVEDKADAISSLLDLANFGLNSQILTKVTATQNFLNTAWQSTTVQKGMTALNTALLIHNASMLSRDLLGTVGDTTSLVLNGFGIQDFEGNDIDVNQTVGTLVQKGAELVIGTENLSALQKSFISANRIIQAANGAILAIQNMKDSSLEGMETIGKWQAQMGNAFIEQGLLEINSYEWMDVDLDLKTPLSGFIGKFEVAQEIVDEISNLASSGIGVIESANELIDQQEEGA